MTLLDYAVTSPIAVTMLLGCSRPWFAVSELFPIMYIEQDEQDIPSYPYADEAPLDGQFVSRHAARCHAQPAKPVRATHADLHRIACR